VDGFHSSGTCGVFGAVVACSKLRGFDIKKTQTSMGIAASQASGLRENFGTMMKPFHIGHAGEVGVLSADLAALGWTASDKIIEAPGGFFHAFGGSYEPETMMHELGNPWTFLRPGVSIKPFPSGSLTHPAMSELQRLMHEHNIKANEVDWVEVGTNHNMPSTLIHHDPKTALQAKFSMEFCMAILLLDRKAGLTEFTDQVVNRPDVQEMIRRIHFVVSAEAEAAGYDKMTSLLKIKLKNGQTIMGRADFAKGSPALPMSYDEVAEKFMGCADSAKWPTARSRKIIEIIRDLEDVADIRLLVELCRRTW
jgi:2-methylcitrate dehydratase PrpD